MIINHTVRQIGNLKPLLQATLQLPARDILYAPSHGQDNTYSILVTPVVQEEKGQMIGWLITEKQAKINYKVRFSILTFIS